MSRYMMATKAIHTLGDISRDEPDLAVIDGEVGEDYIGEWLTGVGYVNVRFPKATTRELTDDEKAYYRTKVVEAPWGTWLIDPDAPPQAATEDASGPADPGEGGGTGAGDREAHGAAQGAMGDESVEPYTEPISQATIDSIYAVVDAPYREGYEFAELDDDDEPLPMAKCGCCVDSPSLPEPKVIKKLKCYSDDELAAMRQAVVEEILARLGAAYDQDEDRVTFGDFESCSDRCPGIVMDNVLAIVREIGAKP